MTRTTPPRPERRAHRRWRLGHYLPTAIPSWSDFAVWGQDLSRGGLGLKTELAVRRGDCFVVRLPGQDLPVDAEVCNVVWLEEEQRFAVGLRWQPRDAAATARLDEYFTLARR